MNPRQGMRAAQSGKPLPWEQGGGLPAARNKCVWQHTVYCGVFPVERVRDQLAEVFQDTGGENFDGRVGGHSALLAFTVNQDGMLIKDSVTVSACAWATGRSANPGPGNPAWLDGFAAEETACTEVLLALGDGKVDVEGGRVVPGERSMLRVAGRLVVGAAVDGVTGGLASLARESVGRLLPGMVGKAASDAAAKATESLAQGARNTYQERRAGAQPAGVAQNSDEDEDQGAAQDGRTVPPARQAGDGDAEGDVPDGPPPEIGTKPLTLADLAGITAWLAERLGVTEILAPETARIKSHQVGEARADEAPQQDMLNSFIADDLDRVADALAAGQGGTVLETYLTPEEELRTGARVDVREEPEQVLAGVDPRLTPAGCWPSSYPLALSQQFAVNRLLDELRDGEGIFSVNGPPGTGKTTLLRDVVAALVTERAARLADLDSPAQAFTGTPHVHRVDGNEFVIHQLADSLTGYEMVVASANNGAVENITTEIPALSAVPESWRETASYLQEPASALFEGEPVWGAVAARLGRRSHRSEFVNRFWWGGSSNNGRRSGGRRGARQQQEDEPPPPQGLRAYLNDSTRRLDRHGWRQAVARFRAAQREVERLRTERAAAADDIAATPEAVRRAERVRAASEAARTQLPEVERNLQLAASEAQRRAAHASRCGERLAAHGAGRPGVVSGLMTMGRAQRTWLEENRGLREQHDAALRDAEAAADVHVRWRQEELRLRRVGQDTEAVLSDLEALADRQVSARQRWGESVPRPEEFAWGTDRETEERRERSAPWADREFVEARARLFTEALRLHEAFLLAGGAQVRRSLHAAMEVVRGSAPAGLSPVAIRAAWQWLFLTVPVVSTTFASYDRMFEGLEGGALGWLFVDEAGQAAPQQAAGALWRTRRAVVVGDPKQLEPVVVLPYTAQQRLRAHHGVEQTWVPTGTSVQQLADRTNQWGTSLPDDSGDGDELWVGAPLRVHRRCDDPMFTISNEIAYGGMMVDGVSEQGREEFTAAQRSVWWDIAATEADGHWVPEEGHALLKSVERLQERGLAEDELYVLSPFRAVAQHASRVLAGRVDPHRIGTVHTAQGRESDVVILVLGTGPDADGSRRWASQRANLLNVAVSRARRRLIVIGNREAWRRHQYFGTLARVME
ncbi:DEAD/DEAH box helicase [Streptomyces smyrnaeus]|uniref:DEAD/DEAH box helicase n=1 Tax=Streptomyces smyrnaeus TaxID=1387713 RepID=UPI0036D09DB0